VYNDRTIAVVVPAYNEELLIADTLSSIPPFVDRIYVVNDASQDKTQEIIEEILRKDPRVVPIRHEKNRGVGAAIISGYKRALNDGMT
jgi:glycosyltransferase involved in cell wall biosynthesis